MQFIKRTENPKEAITILMDLVFILESKNYTFVEKADGMTREKFEDMIKAITLSTFDWKNATLNDYSFSVPFVPADWPYFDIYPNMNVGENPFPGLIFNIFVERWIYSEKFGRTKYRNKNILMEKKFATEEDFTGDSWVIGFYDFPLFSNVSNLMWKGCVIKLTEHNILQFIESEEARIPEMMSLK